VILHVGVITIGILLGLMMKTKAKRTISGDDEGICASTAKNKTQEVPIRFDVIERGDHGIYKAALYIGERKAPKMSAFFPAEWTEAKVQDKIREAFSNKHSMVLDEPNGNKWLIEGETSEGILIKIIAETVMESKQLEILTAYPEIRN